MIRLKKRSDYKRRKKLSVWFITGSLPPRYSGSGRNDLLLAPHISKYGFKITLIAPRYPGDKNTTKIDSIRVLRIIREELLISRLLNPICILKYLIINPVPDIIRMRGFSFSRAFMVFFIKLIFPKIKIAVQPAMYGGDDPISIKAKRGGYFVQKQLIRADAIFSMNELIKQNFLKLGYPEKKIFKIKNPVNCHKFHPVKSKTKKRLRRLLNLPEKPVIISTLGIISSRKNQYLITKAFCQVYSEFENFNLFLIHIGPTASDLRSLGRIDAIEEAKKEEGRMYSVIKNYGAMKNVAFIGNQENPEPYLQASDIFVHASIQEGEPNAINEAMSCGLPCLVPKTELYQRLIPQSCSYKYSADGVNDLSRGMTYLIKNGKIRLEMAESARKFISRTRSPTKVGVYYAKLFKQIIQSAN